MKTNQERIKILKLWLWIKYYIKIHGTNFEYKWKRLHSLAKHKIDSNSKSEKKKN